MLDGRTQYSNNISQRRMGHRKSAGKDRRMEGKGKIQDISTEGVTRAREGAERKINFPLDFHTLRNLQE